LAVIQNFESDPPNPYQLSDRQIHIWHVDLNLSAAKILDLKQLLSADEQERADRLKIPQRRDRFIAGRGILRTILGRYLNQPPQKLKFKYGDRGKPYLDLAASSSDRMDNSVSPDYQVTERSLSEPTTYQTLTKQLYFNLAHSHDLALYAFTYANELGVDLEQIRPMPHADRLAKRFFTESEYAVMQSLTPETRQDVFFKAWTRKEAYLKAVGVGIVQLKQVELSIAPGVPAQVLSIAGDRQSAQCWQLSDLETKPGFAAAVAIESPDLELQYLNFNDQFKT
jgi:4'-phosphopantetheinyl transferase